MRKPFHTELLPAKSDICGGFGAGFSMDPSKLADEVFGAEVPGPWLCCYMMRRFGWPNIGSDDYKQLCTWVLTTPLPGLYLGVTPYLGRSSLHFSVYFNKAVRGQLDRDPGRERYRARWTRAVQKWWGTQTLYSFGCGVEDDEDRVVEVYAEQGGKTWGLWERRPAHAKMANRLPDGAMVMWFIGRFLEKHHPEVKLPKMNKREESARLSRFAISANAAIKATLRDLRRSTYVRDVSFSIFGRVEDSDARVQPGAEPFEGAGYTPEYWFKNQKKIQAKRAAKG